MSQQADKETENYLKERKQEFEWLKKTILQRGDTICGLLKSLFPGKKHLYRQGTSNQASYVKGSCN